MDITHLIFDTLIIKIRDDRKRSSINEKIMECIICGVHGIHYVNSHAYVLQLFIGDF